MGGLLLVYTIIFTSDEGLNYLKKSFGEDRLAAFIHCFEMMLLLENFCKLEQHSKKDLKIMKTGIPAILDFMKKTFNRIEGNGMKIIKFHLCLHYVDDVIRFGSMRNFDSCIGERHHCTEVKDPAKHTQRRKSLFEYQTALRYVDNVVISRGKNELEFANSIQNKPSSTNKNHNVIYDRTRDDFFKRNYKNKKYVLCNWLDHQLHNHLQHLCRWLVDNKYVNGPIHFFTQHNRDDYIFRGDPNYCGKGPWYDWVRVKWNNREAIPAKINIFIDLSKGLLKSFHVGSSFIKEAGYYAIAYSCQSVSTQMSHPTSLLVEYNELMVHKNGPFKDQPELCMFGVNSIASTCIAVPYCVNENIMNAVKWSILKPRKKWYNVLINYFKHGYGEELDNNNENQ
jgi:hypothetical protein